MTLTLFCIRCYGNKTITKNLTFFPHLKDTFLNTSIYDKNGFVTFVEMKLNQILLQSG